MKMFTDFMPNYENMMEKSMGGSKGGGFSNFSSMNVMLEGFMELQKQQMELEKIKAEMEKAKAEMGIDQTPDDAAGMVTNLLFPLLAIHKVTPHLY